MSTSDDQRSLCLRAQMCASMRVQGAWTFKQFMETVLYHPILGYYSTLNDFGRDFTTIPEWSTVFCHLIARSILDQVTVSPHVLELGAGSGAMALEIMRVLDAYGCAPSYCIVEISPALRAQQHALFEKKAPHYLNRVHWLDHIPDTGHFGVVLANEFFDALPVHRFHKNKNGYCEYRVACTEQEEFVWTLCEPDAPLQHSLDQLPLSGIHHYTSEINVDVCFWMRSLSRMVRDGLVLIIDYGYNRSEYYHPQRSMGTLLACHQHQVNDTPLNWPGLQDLTASVDFTALAHAAQDAGFEIAGWTHLSAFLINCLTQSSLVQDEDLSEDWCAQLKRLSSPVGERFKVLALTKGGARPPMGFTQYDRSVYLSLAL